MPCGRSCAIPEAKAVPALPGCGMRCSRVDFHKDRVDSENAGEIIKKQFMADRTPPTVLVVDDTEANIDILVEALSERYEIAVAMDGETALELVAEEPPDLILLDIMMPGIDGYEVCRRLKAAEATRDIPVIFLSALTDVESKTRCFRLGAVDYIGKPFELLEVQARVGTHLEIMAQRARSQALLENLLPRKVVRDLQERGESPPRLFEGVSVLFCDIVDFTRISATLSPEFLIDQLTELFGGFDAIMAQHHCERIKTIGDAYLAVSGMPEPDADHARHILEAAAAMLTLCEQRNARIAAGASGQAWEVRIGVHSGEVVGGIVGTTRYLYDIFGDTVNTASRVEQAGRPMRITVSAATRALTRGEFEFEALGEADLKGKGRMPLYAVAR